MKRVKFEYDRAVHFIKDFELEYISVQIQTVHKLLHDNKGPGNEYSGWLGWPTDYDKQEYNRLKEIGFEISNSIDALIVIGIGGSYLGARSAFEMLKSAFYNQLPKEKRNGPEVYFAGNNISSTYLSRLLEITEDKEIAINVVSKSGTTLEPAIAFRIFKKLIEKKYGKANAKKRIIATTDKKEGALKKLADLEGYRTFVVPDNVGGRYSVLTPVGLFPLAVSGINVDEIMAGAAEAQILYNNPNIIENQCYQYAAIRNILYNKGKTIELLVNYEPDLAYFAEWWKQLFGESQGKDNKGIFPASANFSTDLHSLGQYIQDGRRNLFATTLWVEKPPFDIIIEASEENLDGLNYLADKKIQDVNEKACLGTIMAHTEGGVPNLKINIPELTPFHYGHLVYFFEKACAISGYLLGVNPFDQPGVEAYKKNMFSLLGKPVK
jgi:glucose-6-phosphate isomerase